MKILFFIFVILLLIFGYFQHENDSNLYSHQTNLNKSSDQEKIISNNNSRKETEKKATNNDFNSLSNEDKEVAIDEIDKLSKNMKQEIFIPPDECFPVEQKEASDSNEERSSASVEENDRTKNDE